MTRLIANFVATNRMARDDKAARRAVNRPVPPLIVAVSTIDVTSSETPAFPLMALKTRSPRGAERQRAV